MRSQRMKYSLALGLILLMSCLCPSWAESRHVNHQFGVGIEGGACVVLQGESQDKGLGGQGHLGVDYRIQANHFLMSIGVNAGVENAVFRFNDRDVVLEHSIDQDGYDFDFVYQFRNHRFTHSALNTQLSTLFGGTFNNVYFLLGPSMHFMPKHWAKANTKVATYGDYPQFLDPFTGMPEHEYFNSRPTSESYKLSDKGLFLSASLEVGYAIPLSPEVGNQHLLRVAFYADYCFLNLSKPASTPWSSALIETPATFDWRDMYSNVKLNPLYSTWHQVTGQLSFGIKLTYAISVPSVHRSKYPCLCVDDN